jgi:hypothetical protein
MGLSIRLKTKIRINGKEYESVDEMPADARQAYERALSKFTAGAGSAASQPGSSSGKIVFNGDEYGSVDQMPADVRGMYQRVMAALDTNGNGVPDTMETGGPLGTGAPQVHASAVEAQACDNIPLFVRPVSSPSVAEIIHPAPSSSRFVWVGGVLAALALLFIVMLH